MSQVISNVYLSKIFSYVAIIASIITIAAFWLQIKPSTLELTIDKYYLSNPTNVLTIPNLRSSFLYEGKEVKDLYVSRLRFINTGNKTIVGEGLLKIL